MSAAVLSPAALRHRARLARSVAVAAPIAALAWIIVDWSSIRSGLQVVEAGNASAFAAASVAAALTWIAGAACQQGAVVEHLPRRQLVAVQFAGSAANHILPAGAGVAAINIRFLERRGLTRGRAARAVALNGAAGGTVHVVITLVLILTGATLPTLHAGTTALAIGAGLAGAAVVVLVRLRRRVWPPLAAQLRLVAGAWAAVARRPGRNLQLWAGSAAIPLLHAVTLLCVLRGIGAHLPLGTVFAAYFVSSAASAAIPSPGGFGALDTTLTLALTSLGLHAATSIAAVIAYRIITVWIPLLPSACAIIALRRRAVI